MIHTIIAAGAGFVIGAFTPAVGRKIKSLFVSESKVVVADAKTAVADVTKKL